MATWPWCLEKKPWNMFDLPKCVMNVMVETHLDYKSSRRKNPSYKAAYWSRTSSVQEAPFQDILSKTGCFPLKHDIGRVKRKPPHKNPRSVPQHFSATFSPSFCAMFSTALCLGRGFLLCKRKGPLKVFQTYGFLGEELNRIRSLYVTHAKSQMKLSDLILGKTHHMETLIENQFCRILCQNATY